MKLAVSNIAWQNNELEAHLDLLSALGCDGVEIAPSCIWEDPVKATAMQRTELRRLIRARNLEMAGFHALLYNRSDLEIFRSPDDLLQAISYMEGLIRLCADLEGNVLVFGSPRNRARGGKSEAECFAIAVEFFGKLTAAASDSQVTICIEPLGPQETDFIYTTEQGHRLVDAVNHPNFGLHLDIKALVNGDENIDSAFKVAGGSLRHIHIGDPGLAPPGSTGIDHKAIGKAVHRAGYNRFVSIEMRRGFGETQEVVTNSVRYVQNCYFFHDETK